VSFSQTTSQSLTAKDLLQIGELLKNELNGAKDEIIIVFTAIYMTILLLASASISSQLINSLRHSVFELSPLASKTSYSTISPRYPPLRFE